MKEASLVFACVCTMLGLIGIAAGIVVMHGLPVVIGACCFAVAGAAFAWSLYGYDRVDLAPRNRKLVPLFCLAVGLAVLSNFSYLFWDTGLPPPFPGIEDGRMARHAMLPPLTLLAAAILWWRMAKK